MSGLQIKRATERPGRWDVVHARSGMTVTFRGHSFKKRKDALVFLAKVAPVTDWARDREAILADSDLWEAIRMPCLAAYAVETGPNVWW